MDTRRHQFAGVAAVDVGALALFDDVIRAAIQAGASDIHLEPRPKGVFVRFRKGGALVDGYDLHGMALSLGVAEPPVVSLPRVVKRLLDPTESLSETEIARPREGRISMSAERVELRVSILPTALGESIVLRVSRPMGDGPAIHDLGLPDEMLDAVSLLVRGSRGLLLVCGPEGAGTAVTLRALMRHVDRPAKRLLAIDDQGEAIAPRVTLVQVAQAEGLSFAEGLRCALRHDPDVVMVGDVRDGETTRLAARAASGGVLVLAAMRAENAADALLRLNEWAGEVAEAYIGVLAQRLVRRVCTECAQPRPVSERFVKLAAFLGRSVEGVTLSRGTGCARCGRTGHDGFVGLFELLVPSPGTRDALHRSFSVAGLEEAARAAGMRSLLHDAFDKALAGAITEEDLLRIAFPDMEIDEFPASPAPAQLKDAETELPAVGMLASPPDEGPAVTPTPPVRAAVAADDELAPWAEFGPSDEVPAPAADESALVEIFGPPTEGVRPFRQSVESLPPAPDPAPTLESVPPAGDIVLTLESVSRVRSSPPAFDELPTLHVASPPAAPLEPVAPPSFDQLPIEVDVVPRPRRGSPPRESADVSRRLRRL